MKMMKINIILEKKVLILGICWLMELIKAYKTHSMKLYKPQLRTIQVLTQKVQRNALTINWNLDTDQRSLIATSPSLQYLCHEEISIAQEDYSYSIKTNIL